MFQLPPHEPARPLSIALRKNTGVAISSPFLSYQFRIVRQIFAGLGE